MIFNVGEDEIHTLIKKWTEIQKQRLVNMPFKNVRVEIADKEYYGTLKFNRAEIIIDANAPQISVMCLTESRLNGFMEVGSKRTTLNQQFNKPTIKLVFGAPAQ